MLNRGAVIILQSGSNTSVGDTSNPVRRPFSRRVAEKLLKPLYRDDSDSPRIPLPHESPDVARLITFKLKYHVWTQITRDVRLIPDPGNRLDFDFGQNRQS